MASGSVSVVMLLFFLVIVSSIVAADGSRLPGIEEAQNWVENNGCAVHVCFAIDGSSSLSRREFALQKQFVMDIVSIMAWDENAQFCGVQHGIGNTPISALTDSTHFLEEVNETRFQQSPRTFQDAGIVFCDFSLDGDEQVETRVVVVVDESYWFGWGGGLGAVRRALNYKQYYEARGALSIVGIGNPGILPLLQDIAGAGGGKAFNVPVLRHLSGLVPEVVRQICQ